MLMLLFPYNVAKVCFTEIMQKHASLFLWIIIQYSWTESTIKVVTFHQPKWESIDQNSPCNSPSPAAWESNADIILYSRAFSSPMQKSVDLECLPVNRRSCIEFLKAGCEWPLTEQSDRWNLMDLKVDGESDYSRAYFCRLFLRSAPLLNLRRIFPGGTRGHRRNSGGLAPG